MTNTRPKVWNCISNTLDSGCQETAYIFLCTINETRNIIEDLMYINYINMLPDDLKQSIKEMKKQEHGNQEK